VVEEPRACEIKKREWWKSPMRVKTENVRGKRAQKQKELRFFAKQRKTTIKKTFELRKMRKNNAPPT
jgi:hypothetical protein